MDKYLYHPDELTHGVKPLDFMACKRIELTNTSGAYVVDSGTDEIVFVCISGRFDYKFGQTSGAGQFKDFLYVPWKSKLELSTEHKAVLMQISAPSDRDTVGRPLITRSREARSL